jgi:hypothetical protein
MIIDNFLSDEDYAYVKNYVLGPNLYWQWGEKVSYGDVDHGITNVDAIETFGFNRDIYSTQCQPWYADKHALEFVDPVIKRIIELNGPQTEIIRIRFGMKFHKHGFKDGNYNLPHIDCFYPHKTLILYMNETDGDTYIFNERYRGELLKTFTVKERVSPKENRALIIDGFQYHTASNPLHHDTRVILNINYV